MKKIIFLDIDGTINALSQTIEDAKRFLEYDEFGDLFTEEPVKWLNYIVEQTNADIVMISAWNPRFSLIDNDGKKNHEKADLEKLSRFAKKRGLPDRFIGICHYFARAHYIQEWLDKNMQGQEYRYCWLDDSGVYDSIHKNNVVVPNYETALTEADAMKVIEILNR